MDPNDPLVTPLMLPPVKIDIQAGAMDMIRMPDFDHVVHEFGKLKLDFSKLALGDVYATHHAPTTEIRIQENSLAY